MKTIIDEAVSKLKSEIEKFVKEDDHSLSDAEKYFTTRIKETVTTLLGAYYEEIDARIRNDKVGRKEAGLRIERLGDQREVLTQLGTVRFTRTYYAKTAGGYEYPIDEIAGIESYQRISDNVRLALVENAESFSYAKTSSVVTGGMVSSQTVMNSIRNSHPLRPLVAKRHVPVLHIDADEDHVSLQNGKDVIVPLISCYEGISRHGKRGICNNIFHVSEFRKAPSTLWEEFSDELERRYDLLDTKIYLHGDGATWIKTGLEYLPNCTFVLDRYHVNKAMKQAVAGFDKESKQNLLSSIRDAEISGDHETYESIMESICQQQKENNIEAANYLRNNFDAIHVYHEDPEAALGGATEPHVSHVLSSRLSSRPMGWSAKTLKRFVPILASGLVTLSEPEQEQEETVSKVFKHYLKPKKKVYLANSLGMPDPDIACFPRTRTGHRPYALNLLT